MALPTSRSLRFPARASARSGARAHLEAFLKLRLAWPGRAAYRALTLAVLASVVASLAQVSSPGVQAVGTASGTYFGAYGGSENATLTSLLKREGVQAVRMYIEWADLEPDISYNTQSGLVSTPKLENYDGRLANLKAAGIKPILMVGRAPSWAAPRERGPLYPDKYDHFVRFLTKIAQRWSGPTYDVHHWELWPEPDFGGTIPGNIPPAVATALEPRRAWGDDGAAYANMLKVAYPAIKTVDPASIVILGALAHDWFRTNGQVAGDNRSSPGFNEGGPFVYHFIDDVLDAGGSCCFDWLGFNSYVTFATEWEKEQRYTAWDVAAKAKHIQGRLAAKGVTKPLVAMESGMWSCCTSGAGFTFYTKPDKTLGDFTPDESTQAAYMARLYLRGLSVDLKGIFWWLIEDFEAANDQRTPDNHRGWFTKSPELAPKLSARTMQLMTSRMNGATFAGTFTPARVVSGEVEGYSFSRPDGSTLLAIWNPYGPSDLSVVEIEATGYVIYDASGQSVQTTSAGGNRIRMTVGYMPIFLETFGSLGNRGIVPMLPKSSAASG
jgi:hypothetical protein